MVKSKNYGYVSIMILCYRFCEISNPGYALKELASELDGIMFGVVLGNGCCVTISEGLLRNQDKLINTPSSKNGFSLVQLECQEHLIHRIHKSWRYQNLE